MSEDLKTVLRAANSVVDAWDRGDLSHAVRDLDVALVEYGARANDDETQPEPTLYD